MKWSQESYLKTLTFAAEAHLGQTCPGSDIPYLLHVTLVAMEVMAVFPHEKDVDEALTLNCALLHDTLEDTPTTFEALTLHFGQRVAEGVLALTKNSRLEKSLQMEDSLGRILQQPREIGMVKLADRITNLREPPPHWKPEKIREYLEEARTILETLKDCSPFLTIRLSDKIEAYKRYL